MGAGLGLGLGKFGGKWANFSKNVSLSFGSAPGRPPSGPPGCGMCSGAKVSAETHFWRHDRHFFGSEMRFLAKIWDFGRSQSRLQRSKLTKNHKNRASRFGNVP